MNKQYIILHHSATVDGITNDWKAICRYHTSWRRPDKGEIVTPEQARALMDKGIHCEPPWRGPCGYHWGIERENGVLVVRLGRELDEIGSHAYGFNAEGVGLCMVGNYDKHPPDLYLWDEIKRQIKVIATEIGQDVVEMAKDGRIMGHRETYEALGKRVEKTCPGTAFDLDALRDELINGI